MPFAAIGLGLSVLLAACASAPAATARAKAHAAAPSAPSPQTVAALEAEPSHLPHAVRIGRGDGAMQHLHVATLVEGGRLSDGFGPRVQSMGGRGPNHTGIDIAAPAGTPVRAAAAGRIVQIGWFGAYGRFIRIRHREGLDTAYAHLAAFAEGLRRGQAIRSNQIIGFVGDSGRSTGAHLHFEVLRDGVAVDPLSLPHVQARG